MSQVDDIVLVASCISCGRLIWGISPISIYSKLVLVTLGVQEFHKIMSWRLLTHARLQIMTKPSSLDRLSRHKLVHLFSLPVIEFCTNLNILTTERPFKDMFYLIQHAQLLLGLIFLLG